LAAESQARVTQANVDGVAAFQDLARRLLAHWGYDPASIGVEDEQIRFRVDEHDVHLVWGVAGLIYLIVEAPLACVPADLPEWMRRSAPTGEAMQPVYALTPDGRLMCWVVMPAEVVDAAYLGRLVEAVVIGLKSGHGLLLAADFLR